MEPQGYPYYPYYHNLNPLQLNPFPAHGAKSPEVGTIPDGNAAVIPKSEVSSPEEMSLPTWTMGTPATAPPVVHRGTTKTDKARRKLDLEGMPVPATLTVSAINHTFTGYPLDQFQTLYSAPTTSSATPPAQATAVVKPRARGGKRKVNTASSSTCVDQKDAVPHPPGTPANSRLDNSLLMTTRKFLSLKDKCEVLNLNEAAQCLLVPKRRLYDITNVLEGIDLVEKVGKNSIRWKTPECDENQIKAMIHDVMSLKEEEKRLDDLLHDVTAALQLAKEDPTDVPYSYVRFSDLRSVPQFAGQTLVAIKAPQESYSYIEVADPVVTGKFQLMIRNDMHHPLQALLCPSDSTTCSQVEQDSVATRTGVYPKEEVATSSPNSDSAQQKSHVDRNSANQQQATHSDLVMPPTTMRGGGSGLTTPGNGLGPFYTSPNIFMSPLKMLVEGCSMLQAQSIQSIHDGNAAAGSFLSVEALPNAAQVYSYGDSTLQDLFSGGEWDINAAI